MQVNSSTAALQLVRSDVLDLLNKAGDGLDQFAQNWQQRDGLDDVIQSLLALRGTFELLELPAARRFAQEALEAVQDLAFEPDAAALTLLERLSFGCALIGRYVDYIAGKTCDLPELVLPAINGLRSSRKLPLLPESAFFAVRVPAVQALSPKGFDELNLSGRRQHLMLQLGVVHVLSQAQSGPGLRLIDQACRSLVSSAPDARHKELWLLSRQFVSALEQELVLTPARKRVLGNLERYLAEHLRAANNNLRSLPPELLWRDLFYHLSLCKQQAAGFSALAAAYSVQLRPVNQLDLAEAQLALGAPAESTYRLVLEQVRDELNLVLTEQNHLLVASPGAEINVAGLTETVRRLGHTLLLAEQNSMAQILIEAGDAFGLHSNKLIVACHSAVQTLINSLAKVKLGLDTRLAGARVNSELDGTEPHAAVQDEGRISALTDIRHYLGEVTAAFDGYIAANGQRNHLLQVTSTLQRVCHALTFLNLERLAEPLQEVSQMVDVAVAPTTLRSLPASVLTLIADLLMAVDYGIECLLGQQPLPARVLTLADSRALALRKARRVA
ncbi:hypothetical protein HPT27_07640 [Permianibacter sp. IMCC34836]|uniref:hypothetical protein n=1 Tax=Permianibacter fluminis TaxID=2738515 RepID=UPI001551B43F|nr:hypothetical protein [Permianibacter fluminis]NQD36896.1 hypothetical protein [Permianibacter fluminis]